MGTRIKLENINEYLFVLVYYLFNTLLMVTTNLISYLFNTTQYTPLFSYHYIICLFLFINCLCLLIGTFFQLFFTFDYKYNG